MTRVPDERALWLARHVLPHEPALRAWLKRRHVVEFDIDDIVQDTYAKLVALDSVDAIRDPKSYTFQAAWSIFVSSVRRLRIVSIRTVVNFEQLSAEAPEPLPDRQMEDRDELEQLGIALGTLPEKCLATFTLRRVEGLSQRETAEKLGISEKTVEKHMARGIRLLMDIFGRGGKPGHQASRGGKEPSLTHHDHKTTELGD